MKYVTSILSIFVLSFLLIPAPAQTPVSARTAPARSVGYRFHEPDPGWVAKTMHSMSLRQKVAQLFAVRASGKFLNRHGPEFVALASEVKRNGVGGMVLFAGNVYESAVLINELQGLAALPLLVSADFERGLAFRITDVTSFPWTMAIGATGSEDMAYQEGVITAREARALGVHWVHAPVMDVNNNPDNPVINIRSYGEDPELVARLGAAFIRGAHENGVMTSAKHFPGHGDTATDTHIGLAVVPSSLERLSSVEFVPFKRAIQAGVDAIMTAHVAVPEVTGENGIPATLSPKVLTDLLRGTLRFDGLVVTDAMEMGSITNRFWTGQAAIRALQAGADMLLLPPDTEVAINEVVRAVRRGDLSEARINRSVERLLTAKTTLGLHRLRTVPLELIDDVIASPENQRLAQQIADRSVTLLRDNAHLLPLSPLRPPKIFSLVLSSDLDAAPGAVFQAEMRRRYPGLRTAALDPRTADDVVARIVKSASDSDLVVCATLIRIVSGKGTVALPANQIAIVEKVLASGKPLIFVTFGDPYVLRAIPQVPTYLCTFSYADVSQVAAAKALSGEIAIGGRMPVSIPGCSRYGEGLQVPRLDMTLKSRPPQSLGLAPDAFTETERLLRSYVEKKAFPGGALIVGCRGSIVLDASAGHLDYSAGSDKVTGDTIYDLASLSKVVGTTSAVMMLVDSGHLLLNEAVQDYLPEFKGADKEKVRVRQLLTHSAGLPAYKPLYQEVAGYERIMESVCALPLEYEPGAKVQYSDLGMMLLGEIISRAAARPLDRFLADRLFGPLGMKSTSYVPARSLLPRIAPTENDPWRKRLLRGEVHDENAYALGGVAGHAGLFSSAHDLAVFAQMMLNGGIYDHRRYFSRDTVLRFTSLQTSGEDARALGWGKPVPGEWTGQIFSPEAFGHKGFTGTSLWIDPQRQLFIVLLSNRVHPTRANNLIDEVQQVITESIVRAVTSQAPNSESIEHP